MEINAIKIEEFYKIVQDQISLLNAKKGLDPNVLLINIIANLNLFISSEDYESKDCNVCYGKNNLEIIMWNLSLIIMCWTILNLKNKVIDGHCNNTAHPHGDHIPRHCGNGSNFHYSIYQKCIKSFYDTLTIIEKDLPK